LLNLSQSTPYETSSPPFSIPRTFKSEVVGSKRSRPNAPIRHTEVKLPPLFNNAFWYVLEISLLSLSSLSLFLYISIYFLGDDTMGVTAGMNGGRESTSMRCSSRERTRQENKNMQTERIALRCLNPFSEICVD
jgi:hypothetical protein